MPRGGYRKNAGGKPTWKHGKTKVIRVPEVLAEQILDYAHKLDLGELNSLKSVSAQPIESLKIVDLSGVSLKAINGQMGVMLSDLVKKGYRIAPDNLHKIVVNALNFKNKWK